MPAYRAAGSPDDRRADPEPWARWQDWEQAHTNLRFIQASVDTLSLPPASVDVIIYNQVYEHVPDPQALIHLIHSRLIPIAWSALPAQTLFNIEPYVLAICPHCRACSPSD